MVQFLEESPVTWFTILQFRFGFSLLVRGLRCIICHRYEARGNDADIKLKKAREMFLIWLNKMGIDWCVINYWVSELFCVQYIHCCLIFSISLLVVLLTDVAVIEDPEMKSLWNKKNDTEVLMVVATEHWYLFPFFFFFLHIYLVCTHCVPLIWLH